MTTINSFNGKYSFLSNFYPVEIVYMGIKYPSVEHAYQSAKSNSDEWKNTCTKPIYAGKIKRMSKNVDLVSNWDDIKVSTMHRLLILKFQQDPLRRMLIDTGECQLIEGNRWGDTFWGMCNGIGKNNLGILLMDVRTALAQLW